MSCYVVMVTTSIVSLGAEMGFSVLTFPNNAYELNHWKMLHYNKDTCNGYCYM